jgi:hypothetical protein
MNIKDYTGYFHDGSITSIIQKNNEIEIQIESSEILPEWDYNNFSLTKNMTIKGKLLLSNVKKIENNNKILSSINRICRDGELLRLIIEKGTVELFINWYTYPPEGFQSTFEHITIEASEITWIENRWNY